MGRHVFIAAEFGCAGPLRREDSAAILIRKEDAGGMYRGSGTDEVDTDKFRRGPELKCHDLERAALFVVFN